MSSVSKPTSPFACGLLVPALTAIAGASAPASAQQQQPDIGEVWRCQAPQA